MQAPSSEPGTLTSSSIAALALAVAIACAGQYVLAPATNVPLSEGSKQAIGGAMLIGGALLFGLATRRQIAADARLEFPKVTVPPLMSTSRRSLQWLVVAIALGTGAVIAFAFGGESLVVVLAWLASIVALLWSQIDRVPVSRLRTAREPRPYLAALGAVLVVACVTRVFSLTTLPYNLDGDFASVGLSARALTAGPWRIFAYDWAGVPRPGFLLPALTMALFGDGLAGLNAAGIVAGLLSIAGVYLLGRDLFHPRVGLFAAALLATSYAHVAASRQPHCLEPVPLLVFSMYLLLLGLREDRGAATVASGALAGLCLEVYSSGRIIAPIAVSLLVYLLLFNGAWLRQRWRDIALWAVAVLLTLGPMLIVFARDIDTLTRRVREIIIFNPDILRHQEGVYKTHDLGVVLLEQARRSALLFHYYPDTGTQFALGVPMLDSVTAILFTLGIGCALFGRRTGSALLLPWTVLVVVLGSMLTANPPFWPHLLALLPPAALFAALALNQLYETIARLDAQHQRRARRLAAGAVTVMLALMGVENWKTYVTAKGSYATPRTRIGRYLAATPSLSTVYLVSNEFRSSDREFAFLVPGRFAGDLAPRDVEANASLLDSAMTLILSADQEPLLRRLEKRHPAGSAEKHAGNDPSEAAFFVFRPAR